MADITLKDYWVIQVGGHDWIKVDEDIAKRVMNLLQTGGNPEFIDVIDMFGSYCLFRLSEVHLVFHLNDDILRAGNRHAQWIDKLSEI